MVGRHLPAHMLGRNPKQDIIYASYNDERATDVGRKVRTVIEDPRFREIHPKLIVDPANKAATSIGTEAGGGFFAVGRGGACTGRRAHAAIVDDILKDMEEAESLTIKEGMWDWYTSVLRTRLHPGGGIIIMSTRWAVDDLAGRVLDLAKANPQADQWCVVSIPALAEEDEKFRKKGESFHEERFSKTMLESTRATSPAKVWFSLYQQSPYVPTGHHFKADWFSFYTPAQLPSNLRYYLTTDFAASEASGDHSESWVFGIDDADNIWWMADPFHAQCEIATHDETTWDLAEKYQVAGIFVEKGVLWKAHGGGFRQQSIGRRFYPKIIEIARTKAKLEASAGLKTHMQRHKVFWPDTPFIRDVVIPQFLRFTGEKGGKDDLVDECALPFLAFKELQRPMPVEFEDEELNVDPTTKWILDRMGTDKTPPKYAFGAGDRDGSNPESDGDEYDTEEEPFR